MCITTRHTLKRRSLQRHAKSARHVAAVKAMQTAGCIQGVGALEDDIAAPSTAEFAKVIEHLKKQPLGRDGVPFIAGRDKPRNMYWCVAEACRAMKRNLWLEADGLVATTISKIHAMGN